MMTPETAGPRSIAFVSERMLLGFGVDLVIHEVATRLQRRGHDVTVYASVTDDSVARDYRVRTIPTRASGVPQRYQSAARWWADYIDAHEHDVAFIESFPYFSLIPALKTPTVAVDHGVSSPEGMPIRQRSAFKYIERTQQRRYFPAAAGLVTISQYVRSLLPEDLQPRARVIYNGADHYPEAPVLDRQTMRARLGIGDDRVMCLYVGRLSPSGQPYKGTADLLGAARRWAEECPAVQLVMAGTGDEVDAALVKAAGAIPVLNVPHDEMAALHGAADVYVTASRWEGFDLPLVEAAFQGVPSVALRIGAHPEVVRDGQTGILCDSVDDLVSSVTELAGSRERRSGMGASAHAWARRFPWDGATDSYERVVAELARSPSHAKVAVGSGAGSGAPPAEAPAGSTATTAEKPVSDVTVVVLNYGATAEVLRKCVRSLVEQTYSVNTLLVDNGSPKNQDAVAAMEAEFPEIKVLQLDKNYGFAGGMNRGVEVADTEFVLLLNNDAVMEPGAVEEMRKTIEGREDVVGIAPKILLEDPPGFIDAIGNLVDHLGQAYNMGIGQLDIGQYDREEETFGACFAATLLRRDSWREGLVGPLDERYFMYYEDVDWCFRAGVLGYKFLTCPTAVVHHTHSLSTRALDYGFKYRMIMRNFIRTIIKDFQGRSWMRPTFRRCFGLLRNSVRGPHRGASFLALKDVAISFPHYWRARRAIQGRRKTPDWDLFNFAHGENVFFDPASYQPVRRLETLAAMYNRKFLLEGDDRYREIAVTALAVAGSRLRFDRKFARERLAPLLAGEPEAVRKYLEDLEV
jgi:GT2 family glycosyltransferase/glycosyltransferase involved in cell wall biosynthesis